MHIVLNLVIYAVIKANYKYNNACITDLLFGGYGPHQTYG